MSYLQSMMAFSENSTTTGEGNAEGSPPPRLTSSAGRTKRKGSTQKLEKHRLGAPAGAAGDTVVGFI